MERRKGRNLGRPLKLSSWDSKGLSRKKSTNNQQEKKRTQPHTKLGVKVRGSHALIPQEGKESQTQKLWTLTKGQLIQYEKKERILGGAIGQHNAEKGWYSSITSNKTYSVSE